VSIQRDSLGRFMNPWEIPGRGCDLLAGQREYALRFWPASFHTTWNTRETQAPSVNLSEGAAIGWIHCVIRQSKAILARSCEAGRAIQHVPQPSCLKKERERLVSPAPLCRFKLSGYLLKKTAHGPFNPNASERSSMKNPKKFKAFASATESVSLCTRMKS
jgi:hypothetical protein